MMPISLLRKSFKSFLKNLMDVFLLKELKKNCSDSEKNLDWICLLKLQNEAEQRFLRLR
jgi:hypothetical protein